MRNPVFVRCTFSNQKLPWSFQPDWSAAASPAHTIVKLIVLMHLLKQTFPSWSCRCFSFVKFHHRHSSFGYLRGSSRTIIGSFPESIGKQWNLISFLFFFCNFYVVFGESWYFWDLKIQRRRRCNYYIIWLKRIFVIRAKPKLIIIVLTRQVIEIFNR